MALQPVLVPEALQAEAGQPRGLMIMRVVRDGPVAKAGIVVEDIFVTLDGEGVSRPLMVTEHLGPESIDRPVQLRLIRAGNVVALGDVVAAQPFNSIEPRPDRLRVAVAAVDLPARKRLASLVEQSGHEVVELEGLPRRSPERRR